MTVSAERAGVRIAWENSCRPQPRGTQDMLAVDVLLAAPTRPIILFRSVSSCLPRPLGRWCVTILPHLEGRGHLISVKAKKNRPNLGSLGTERMLGNLHSEECLRLLQLFSTPPERTRGPLSVSHLTSEGLHHLISKRPGEQMNGPEPEV